MGSENIVVVSSCDATCNSDTVTTTNEDLKTIKEKRSREDAFGSGSNNYVRADSILQSERSATAVAIIVTDDNDRAVDESIIVAADDDNNDYDRNEEESEADISMDGDDENEDVDSHGFPFAVVEQQPRQGRDDEDMVMMAGNTVPIIVITPLRISILIIPTRPTVRIVIIIIIIPSITIIIVITTLTMVDPTQYGRYPNRKVSEDLLPITVLMILIEAILQLRILTPMVGTAVAILLIPYRTKCYEPFLINKTTVHHFITNAKI